MVAWDAWWPGPLLGMAATACCLGLLGRMVGSKRLIAVVAGAVAVIVALLLLAAYVWACAWMAANW